MTAGNMRKDGQRTKWAKSARKIIISIMHQTGRDWPSKEKPARKHQSWAGQRLCSEKIFIGQFVERGTGPAHFVVLWGSIRNGAIKIEGI